MRKSPSGGAAYIRDHALRGNLLNQFEWGGYLIYRVPERKVFVPRFPGSSVVVVDVDQAQAVSEGREVRAGAVRPLVEVRMPDVQAVSQIRDRVEDLRHDPEVGLAVDAHPLQHLLVARGRAAELQKELETLFTAQDISSDAGQTSILATFLRITVMC